MAKQDEKTPLWKTVVAYLFIVFAVSLMLKSITAFWFTDSIYDQQQFVSLTTEVFTDEQVKAAVEDQIFEAVFEGQPVLREIANRTIRPAISGLLDGDQYRSLVEGAARVVHNVVISNSPQDITLDITIFKTIVTILSNQTELVNNINPDDIPSEIVLLEAEQIPNVHKLAFTMVWLGPLAGFISVVLLAIFVVFSRHKALHLLRVGLIMAIMSFLYKITIPYMQNVLVASTSGQNARLIVGKIYEVFTRDLVSAVGMAMWLGIFFFVLGWLFYKFPIVAMITGTKAAKKRKSTKSKKKSTKKSSKAKSRKKKK